MRKIRTKDVFTLARIIKKAKLKEQLKKLDLTKASVEEIGMTLIFSCIEAGATTEKEIYELIKDITGQDIKEMDIGDTIKLLEKIAQENDLTNFLEKATLLK